MKSNELRIGNMVMISEVKCKVIGIEGCKNIKNGFSVFDTVRLSGDGINSQQQIYCQGVSPIALTEEILLKCGFNKIYVTDPQLENSQSKWYIDDLEIFKFEDNHEYLFFSFGQDFKIIYLHQLQNLYFELTGKELEIKL